MTDPSPAGQDRDQQILKLNQDLLDSVVTGDWSTYAALCSDDLTCFEAETNGVLAEGLPFHHYYFDLPSVPAAAAPTGGGAVQVTMARPHLRWLGEDAVVLCYTRLTQRLSDGSPVTASCTETRVWQRLNGSWKQVHVHRS